MSKYRKNLKTIELIFETLMWNFRLFTILPVVFGLLSSLTFFIIGSKDIWYGISLNFCPEKNCYDPYDILGYIIGGIDFYLVGVVLLIFSFGIYELFISRIDIRLLNQEINILSITSLDELKHKILQVVVVVLVVSFFKKSLSLEMKTLSDSIYLALSILIIAISSYLMHLQSKHDHDKEHNSSSKNDKNVNEQI